MAIGYLQAAGLMFRFIELREALPLRHMCDFPSRFMR